MDIVFFSSISNNTKRFVDKLGLNAYRIPISINETLNVKKDFILITPTYGGGNGDKKGCVPRQVIHFLNNINNRMHCKAVISSGNTNFGDTYCLAGPIISKKLNIPLLYQFELLGTKEDVEKVRFIIQNFKGEK